MLRFGITTLSFDRATLRWLVPTLGAAALAIGTPVHASAASEGARVAASRPDSSAVQALPAAPAVAPLLAGLDGYHFAIESRDPRVRRYFDQGMLLAFGFNPEEAARSFDAALAIDPACASCWWALAWALGPTINADMSAQAAARVDRAVAEARRHAHRAAPTRRALIEALALRHPQAGVTDEAAYAQRMRTLAQRHPGDALVALLAAEALLNLHPYDWWSADGTPRPWTPEIAGLLERCDGARSAPAGSAPLLDPPAGILAPPAARPAQRRFPARRGARFGPPAAHACAYRHAGRALRGGDPGQPALDRGRPALSGPGGRTGRLPRGLRGAQPPLPVGRRVDGRPRGPGAAGREAAWPAACGPAGRDPGSAIVQQYAVLPYFTRVRFGDWAALLHDTPPPDSAQPYPLAIWHYARGTARARSGQLELAQQELAQLQRLAAEPALAHAAS